MLLTVLIHTNTEVSDTREALIYEQTNHAAEYSPQGSNA